MKKAILLSAVAFLICSALVVFAGPKTDSYDLEIYAGEKLFLKMPVPGQTRGRYVYSFTIYRVPEDQTVQTEAGERVYAFQILPNLDDSSVNVEVAALLEDPKTISEEHPLHKFKKHSLGFYHVHVGESVVVSEMTKLGAKPLTLKMVPRS